MARRMTRRSTAVCVSALVAFACTTQPTPSPNLPTASPPASAIPPVKPAPAPYEVLLAEWTGPHGGGPPWDKVETALLGPAIEKAGEIFLAEIDTIAARKDAPSF